MTSPTLPIGGERLAHLTLLAAALGLGACAASQRPSSCVRVETLASYPHGNFLENLIVEPSGRVLFTSYMAREIAGYTPQGAPTRFAALPAHPVSLLALPEGYLVAAHGVAFTGGPAFLESNRFLVLDREGAVARTVPAPEARFLNGMTALSEGVVLVADSVLGRIWRLEVATGGLTPWLDAPELRPDPTGQDPRPGVNGLKREGDHLHVSSSFQGRIYTVRIGADGRPEGELREVAAPGRVDDFVLAPDGGYYAATHADTVVWTLGASVRTVLPEGGDGSTAVAYADPGRRHLYVLTTGGLLEGKDAPARLLSVALPGGASPCPAD